MSAPSLPSSASLPLAVQQHIDDVCLRFEAAWRDGGQPRLEDYLEEATPEERLALLPALLAVELGYRVRRGEAPTVDTYGQRFPGCEAFLPGLLCEALACAGGDSCAQSTPHQPSENSTGAGGEAPGEATGERSQPAQPDLGDYEIQGELGKGGMGVVYRARQRRLKRVVALKVIRADKLAELSDEQRTAWLRRFHTEAQAAAQLQHEHLLPVYEVGPAAGPHYYSMRYVEGRSLAELLHERVLANREAAVCLERIARAVHHAHQAGILHRDVKPGNILLDADSHPYVTDFGLAKWVDGPQDMTQSGQVLGSPAYMPPEQARDPTGVTAASDVYSLGATLYAALTGGPPFQAATVQETFRRAADDDPVPPRRINPAVERDLETICLKCLRKQPEQRYASAADLAADLRRYLEGQPIRARPTPRWERLLKWGRRYPIAAALIGALVAGFLGISASAAVAWEQRNRAKAAEEESEQRRLQSLLDTARLAVQRGAWHDALKFYDEAVAQGYPNTVALRLDKIRAWKGSNQTPRAFAEARALAQEPDLGDLAGQVDLVLGELLFGIDDVQAMRLIRRAKEQVLSPANRLYAEGLTTEHSPTALKFSLQAVKEDRLHQDARFMAGFYLLLLGRFEEGRNLLRRSEELFPWTPSFPILLGFMDAFEGKAAAAKQRLERLGAQITNEERAALAAGMEGIQWLHDTFVHRLYAGSKPRPQLQQTELLTRLAPHLPRLVPQDKGLLLQAAQADAALPLLRAPPFIMRTLVRLAKVGLSLGPPGVVPDEAIEEVARLVADNPEGFGIFFHASFLFIKLKPRMVARKGKGEELIPEWQFDEVARLYQKAMDTPALLPVRQPALDALIGLEAYQGLVHFPGNVEKQKLAVEHLRQRLRLGPIPTPTLASLFCDVARNAGEFGLAREVLSQWKHIAAKDPKYDVARVRLELATRAYGPAIKAARSALATYPANEQLKALLKEAVNGLQTEFREHVLPPLLP